MKNIRILFILISFCCLFMNAQQVDSLLLQEDYSFASKVSGKPFMVLEFPNFTQHDLYSNVLLAINTIAITNDEEVIVNGSKRIIPKDKISTISEESIIFTTIRKAYSMKLLGMPITRRISFNLKFQFKDGKIRIEAEGDKMYSGDLVDDCSFSKSMYADDVMTREVFEPTGNEKKDSKNLKKINEKNSKYIARMDGINDAINSTIEEIMLRANKSSLSEDW